MSGEMAKSSFITSWVHPCCKKTFETIHNTSEIHPNIKQKMMDADIITDDELRNIVVVMLSSCFCLCCHLYIVFIASRNYNLKTQSKLKSLFNDKSLLIFAALDCIWDHFLGSGILLKAEFLQLCLIIFFISVTQNIMKGKQKKATRTIIMERNYFVQIRKSITGKLFLLSLLFASNILRAVDNFKNDFVDYQYSKKPISNHHVRCQASGNVIGSKYANTTVEISYPQKSLLEEPLLLHEGRYYRNVKCNNVAGYYNSSLNVGYKFDIRIDITKPREKGTMQKQFMTSSPRYPIFQKFSNFLINDSELRLRGYFYTNEPGRVHCSCCDINHVIRVNPGARFTFEPSEYFKLQRNDTIIYKINNQSVHKVQAKQFLSGCSIFTYLYNTIQNWLQTFTGLVDRKNFLQKSMGMCVPYNAMGYLSVTIKREVTRDDHTCEIDLLWTAYILPLKTLPWFKTYFPPNVSSTNEEWLYWQEVNQDAILHWSITLLYEVLFFVSVTALFAKRLINFIIRRFRNLRRFLNRRKRCITGLTFDFIILTSERDNEAVYDMIVIPLKQFGYQLCFPAIDALPGESIITTLFRLADKSSKFILVTSPNFKEGSFEWSFMYEALVAQRYLNYELTYTDVTIVELCGNVPREITHTLNKVKIIHNFLELSRPSRDQELLKISSDFRISGFYFPSMIDIIDWFLLTFPDFEI